MRTKILLAGGGLTFDLLMVLSAGFTLEPPGEVVSEQLPSAYRP